MNRYIVILAICLSVFGIFLASKILRSDRFDEQFLQSLDKKAKPSNTKKKTKIQIQIQNELKTAIHTLKQSKTEDTWKMSGYTAHELFDNWTEISHSLAPPDPKFWHYVCEEIWDLKPEHQTLYIDEIQRRKDLNLACLAPIQTRVSLFWSKQTETPFNRRIASQDVQNEFKDPAKQLKQITKFPSSDRSLKLGAGEYGLVFKTRFNQHYLNSVLRILKQHHLSAHFFFFSGDAYKNQDFAEKLSKQGHVVGFLGKSIDQKLEHLTLVEMEKAVNSSKESLEIATRADTHWHLPENVSGPNPYLSEILKRKNVFWITDWIRAQDWKPGFAQEILDQLINEITIQKGSWVVFDADQPSTTKVLPLFLSEMNQRGYLGVLLKTQEKELKKRTPASSTKKLNVF